MFEGGSQVGWRPHNLFGWRPHNRLEIIIHTISSLYIDSVEEVVNLFEVDLQKPRNLTQ